MKSKRKPKEGKTVLVGVATDTDGHQRVTRGEDFTLIGGTKESHEKLQDVAMKVSEDLNKRGKSIETVEATELRDMILKANGK